MPVKYDMKNIKSECETKLRNRFALLCKREIGELCEEMTQRQIYETCACCLMMSMHVLIL